MELIISYAMFALAPEVAKTVKEAFCKGVDYGRTLASPWDQLTKGLTQAITTPPKPRAGREDIYGVPELPRAVKFGVERIIKGDKSDREVS